MATISSIKTTINSTIRTETAAGGITPDEVSDILDSVLNEIRDRGILWVADATAVAAQDPTDSVHVGAIDTGIVYRHNGTSYVAILTPGSGGGGSTQLATPTLTATVISSTQIDLSWTNVSNESSYKLEWSPNGTSGWTQIGGTIAANTTTYSHTGLTASTQYFYRITAVGDGVTYTDSGYGTDNDTTSAGYETESETFFAANTGLSTTIKDAVDDLVIAMKGIGWTKFKAVYPFVGGTAAAHKWNLVNPVDTDGGYRIVWNGTLTHDSNGVTGGGTIADYGDTKVDLGTALSGNDGALGVYVRSGWDDTETAMGVLDGTNNAQLVRAGGATYFTMGVNNSGVSPASADPSAYTRLLVISRIGTLAADADVYRDGTDFGDGGNAFNAYPTGRNVTLFARNNAGTMDVPGNMVLSFAFIADGLTSGEISTLNTAVNTFQTALSRNV